MVDAVHGLLEGPRWLADGSVIYSDVTGGGVFAVAGDQPERQLLGKRRGIGGLLPHAGGGIVASGRSMLHFDGNEQRELLSVEGVAGFNDLATDSEGRVYAGALRFHPLSGEEPTPGEVWRIEADGSATIVASGIDWANGIVHSADDSLMYVSDTAAGVIKVFERDDPHSGEVFAAMPRGVPDGLALDTEGALWVALGNGGIARFSVDGELDRLFDVPADFTSSLCFGGADGRRLFVTTADLHGDERGGVVLTAGCEVAGAPLTPARI